VILFSYLQRGEIVIDTTWRLLTLSICTPDDDIKIKRVHIKLKERKGEWELSSGVTSGKPGGKTFRRHSRKAPAPRPKTVTRNRFCPHKGQIEGMVYCAGVDRGRV
jgi:hypothetical protein